MFVVKTIHRGNNFKKLLRGKITKNIPQLISISENHIEIFDYEIDENLNVPYLLLNIEQYFIFHILDAEIINYGDDKEKIVILTTCGLIILEFINQMNVFDSKAAVTFLLCEPRDMFMYLKVVDRYIITYSLTNQINIFLMSKDCRLNALKFSPTFTENIVDIILRLHQGIIIVELILTDYKSIAFIIKQSHNTIEKCYDDAILFYNNNVRDILRTNNIVPYKFLISPSKKLLFIFSEGCYFIVDHSQKSPLKTVKFENSTILISSVCFDNYIQLIFDKNITFYRESFKNNNIKDTNSVVEIKYEGNHQNKLFNKSVIWINSNYFLLYDNTMNIFFTKYESNNESNTLNLNLLNEFQNSTFYCLDSKLIKNKLNENQIYALCGIKGKSRIVRYVKGMEEVKIKTFNYLPKIKGIFDLKINNNLHILVINLYSSCQILTICSNNNQMELNGKIVNQEFFLENEFILDANFILNKYISLSSRNGVLLYELNYSPIGIEGFICKSVQKIDNILFIKAFEFQTKISFIVFTNINVIRIFSYENDELVKEGETSYFKDVTTFDFFIQNNILNIVSGTYGNFIEWISYDLINKNFQESISCSIQLDSEFYLNHIKLIENVIFITSRNGHFGVFSLYEGNIHLINQVKISEDPSLSIDYIKRTSEGYLVTIFGEEDCFNLSLNDTLERVLKFKFIINENFKKFNTLKTIEYDDNLYLYLYQNSESNRLQLSYFFRYNRNNQVGETLRLFNYNQLAKKMLNFNNTHLYILLEKHEDNVIKSSIYIYCIESKTESLIFLDDEITKVNSIRIMDFIYEDESLTGSKRFFLFICAELNKGQKGCLYIYKIENDSIIKTSYSHKCVCEKPIIDCQRLNYQNNKNNSTLVMIMESKLCTLQVEYDQVKLKITALSQQNLLNKLNSLNTFPNSDHVIVGDSTESFNVQTYDTQKQRFEIVGSDIAMRYLYKTISDEDFKNVGLIQKNGVYSHFYLNDDIYEIKASIDLKELLTEMSIITDIDKAVFQKLFVSTGLLGSINFIGEINLNSLLNDFNIGYKEIIEFQNKLVQTYSKLLFKKEVNIDQLMYNSEPNLNFIIFDLIEILRKDLGNGNFVEIESLPEYEKIMCFFSKIEEIFENFK